MNIKIVKILIVNAIAFIASLLARIILEPEYVGKISILYAFAALSSVFDFGLNQLLVNRGGQRKKIIKGYNSVAIKIIIKSWLLLLMPLIIIYIFFINKSFGYNDLILISLMTGITMVSQLIIANLWAKEKHKIVNNAIILESTILLASLAILTIVERKEWYEYLIILAICMKLLYLVMKSKITFVKYKKKRSTNIIKNAIPFFFNNLINVSRLTLPLLVVSSMFTLNDVASTSIVYLEAQIVLWIFHASTIYYFPKISKIKINSHLDKDVRSIKKIVWLYIPIIYLVIYVCSQFYNEILFKDYINLNELTAVIFIIFTVNIIDANYNLILNIKKDIRLKLKNSIYNLVTSLLSILIPIYYTNSVIEYFLWVLLFTVVSVMIKATYYNYRKLGMV